jgi:hypothetical protein
MSHYLTLLGALLLLCNCADKADLSAGADDQEIGNTVNPFEISTIGTIGREDAIEEKIPRSLSDFPDIKEETDINVLVKFIDKNNCLYSSAVGIAGAYTKEYAAYERLMEIIDEDKLLELIKHTNPIIRAHAFDGLVKKKSTLIDKVFEKLKEDTAVVCSFSGCLKMCIPLSQYVTYNNEKK